APSTTWLFVRISPSAVRTMPVPAPNGRSPSAPTAYWDVLMSTIVPTGLVAVEPEEGDGGTMAPVDGIAGGAAVWGPPVNARSVPTRASDTSIATRSAIQPRARCGPPPSGWAGGGAGIPA